MAPPGDGGDDIAPSGVPLYVGGHVVLCYVHHGAVWRVHEGQSSIHTTRADTGTNKRLYTQLHRRTVTSAYIKYCEAQIRVRIRSLALIRCVSYLLCHQWLLVSVKHTTFTDLLSPASTKNCPWGLQKMLLACCLSYVSVDKKDKVSHLVEVNCTWDCETCALYTHLWARSCRCSWHDRRRRWSWEALRGEQRTCCRWVPMQTLWCPLDGQKHKKQLNTVLQKNVLENTSLILTELFSKAILA